MRGTFDDVRVEFRVSFMQNNNLIHDEEFSALYGLGIHTYLERNRFDSMNLTSDIPYSPKIAQIQRTVFANITPAEDDLTFEDTITNYLTNPINYENFDDVQKIHALCFLERYSMDYEKTNDIKKKYVKKK